MAVIRSATRKASKRSNIADETTKNSKRQRVYSSTTEKAVKNRNDQNENENENEVNDFSILTSLPREMVLEILTSLAASSRVDLFKAKLSCRLFNEVASDDHIYRNMSLDDLPLKPEYMRPKQCSLFLKCLQCENPRALYKEGTAYFLGDREDKYGLDCLNRAANSGHAEASYILGIDLICNGLSEREKERGMELLRNNVKTSRAMRECRSDLRLRFRVLKPAVTWSVPYKYLDCPMIDPQKPTPAWPLLDFHEDQMKCGTCRLNLEIYYAYCTSHELDYYLDPPQRCEIVID